MARNVMVIGPPRSGTSLTASVFARQSYYVAAQDSEVRVGDDHNPFGYWEANGLIARNVEVLRRAGFSHHNTWHFDPITPEQVARINALEPSDDDRRFVEEYNRNAPWMWKDPRLCYTIGYWWRLVPRDSTVVLIVRRDLEAVYHSFRRLGWCEPGPAGREAVFRRVGDHARHAIQTVQDLGAPHLVVEYEEYLITPQAVGQRIGALCGVELQADDLNVRRELDHSTPRGRLSAWMRHLASRLPPQPYRLIRRLIPDPILRLIVTEKRYVPTDRPRGE